MTVATHNTQTRDEENMLAPVTQKYKDFSTPEHFAFAFYCDRCGEEWRSDIYSFNPEGFEPPVEEKIRIMLWSQQHEAAYERSNREAGAFFNRCPVCSCRVCDNCVFEARGDEPCDCKIHTEQSVKHKRL